MEADIKWIKRGRQKRTIFQILRKPMTSSEICRAYRVKMESDLDVEGPEKNRGKHGTVVRQPSPQNAPVQVRKARRELNVQIRDVWYVMRQFEHRRLAFCLNRNRVTGKLFFLTDYGRKIAHHGFNMPVSPMDETLDWGCYSKIVSAKTRRCVLLELVRPQFADGVTASILRRSLRFTHPIGLNPTLRALKELVAMQLVAVSMRSLKDPRRGYTITGTGRRIVEQFQK